MTDVTGYTKAGADAAFATAAQLAGKVDSSALATVATTGSYSDLANIPASVPTTWDSVTGKPTFSTVATSGSYTDLANKPTIPAAQVQPDWSAGSGLGAILNKPTIGTAAAQNVTAFATAAQGAKADTAVQPGALSTVATSGSYADLSNKPTIPAAQVQTDWNASSGLTSIANKPTLGTAAAQPTTAFATAVQGNKADAAVPQAVASGASAVRIIGYGTTLPGTATAGDVFFLQGT